MSSDSAGYLLFKLSTLQSSQTNIDYANNMFYSFESLTLQMNASIFSNNSSPPTVSCKVFDNSEICIKGDIFDPTSNDSIVEVGVQYKIDTEANLFPTTILPTYKYSKDPLSPQILPNNSSLSSYIIGFSINNGTVPNNEIHTADPVIIKFYHDIVKVSI